MRSTLSDVERSHTNEELHAYLLEAYRQVIVYGLPDRRRLTCIDDHNQNDHYALFCRITIELNTDGSLDLALGYAPTNAAVVAVVKNNGGQVTDNGAWRDIRIKLTAADSPLVRQLAKAIKQVVGRGADYPEKNWKWMCRRTTGSLEQLAIHLKNFERMRRNGKVLTQQAAAPNVTTVVPTDEAKTVRRSKLKAVAEEVDDEENLFKICGVE